MDKPCNRAVPEATQPRNMFPAVYLVHPVTREHCYTCATRRGHPVPWRLDLDTASEALGVEPGTCTQQSANCWPSGERPRPACRDGPGVPHLRGHP